MVLRAASPNWPAGGATKHAVLKKCSGDRSLAGKFGLQIWSARVAKTPPPPVLLAAPVTVAVKGVPVCAAMLPLSRQLPSSAALSAFLREAVTVAERKFVEVGCAKLLAHVERGEAVLGRGDPPDSAPRPASRRQWSWRRPSIFRRCKSHCRRRRGWCVAAGAPAARCRWSWRPRCHR